MKEVTIQLSKTKITLLFLGSIGFVALLFWLILNAESKTLYNTLYLKTISIFGIIFLGIGSIYFFVKLFDKKPGLIINDEGIIDNSSALRAGLIKWENITNVSISEISGQKFLTIEVNNPDEIISKQKGFKKILMTLNKDFFNSPVHISSNTLKCNLQDLYNLIKERLSVHRISQERDSVTVSNQI